LRILFIIGLSAVALSAPTESHSEITFSVDPTDTTIWFGTETFSLHIDRSLHYEAFHCDGTESLSVTLPLAEVAPGIAPHTISLFTTEVADFAVGDWVPATDVSAIASPELGDGLRLTVRAPSVSHDLEQHFLVEFYESHPDAAILRSCYHNTGNMIHTVTRTRTARLLLDLRRTDPQHASWGFRSVQPTIDGWGDDWIGLPLSYGFDRRNPMIGGSEYGRGGMPFIDLWGPSTGIALASLEPLPTALDFPCRVRTDGLVEVAVETRPTHSFGQLPFAFAPGDSLLGPRIALIVHRGDFYDAAHRYGRLLDATLVEAGGEAMGPYPDAAYKPYWKTWGYGTDFSVDDIYANLDDLADLGFERVGLDGGWFDLYGSWDPDPTKFPAGVSDLLELIDDLHTPQWGSGNDSFEVMMWWCVTAWEPGCGWSTDLLIRDESGYPLDDRHNRYFCPAYPPAVVAVLSMIDKMMGDWGVDVLYMDGAGLQNVPPCYNDAHGHAYPAEAPEKLPDLYRAIRDRARMHQPDGCLILCECSTPHDPYKRPFYDHEDASDPITDRMVRWKTKFIKAVRGASAPVGDGYVDPMPFNELSGTFAYGLGTGAVLTSTYASLGDLGESIWNEWASLYRTARTTRSDILNVYPLGFTSPEGHALLRGDGSYVHTFTSDTYWAGEVELRGLQDGVAYDVYELDTGTCLGSVIGPTATTTISMRQQSAGKPYWSILQTIPEDIVEVQSTGGGDPASVFRLAVSPVPAGNHVAIDIESIQSAGGPARVTVYDISGRLVRALQTPFGVTAPPGSSLRLTWDGRDEGGRRVVSGVYMVRTHDSGVAAASRILIVR